MRAAISQTFPKPNRHLLHRILKMMQVIASHKAENRMITSDVAACMAPLLLRPLLAGDFELDNDFALGRDGSVQLLQDAAAANHVNAIFISLLEECNNIFRVAFNPVTNSIKTTLSRICKREQCSDTADQIDLIAKASGTLL